MTNRGLFGTDVFHQIVLQLNDEARTGLGSLLDDDMSESSSLVFDQERDSVLSLSPRYTPGADDAVLSKNDEVYSPFGEEAPFSSTGWETPVPITPKEKLEKIIENLKHRTHFGMTI